MKKNFLFGLMAITLAVFGFGGVSMAAEASIGGVSYDSLVDAIAQANGKTVKLENNVSLTNMLMIENTTMTLDLNGYNIEKTNGIVIFVGTNGNLTIEGNGFVGIPTDNKDGTAIVVRSGGKATINDGSYQGGTAVYAYGMGSEVIINSGKFVGTKSGNRAAIHSVVDSLITINGGRFTAQPTDSGKPQKVIYAGANTNKCNTPSTTDSDLYVPGKIIVNGGYLQGRFSRSNLGEYEIKSGTLKPYQDKTAGVNCNYNNCDNGTDDPTSCTDMPGVTSMLNEGYVATSDGEGAYVISYDPAATIGENGYSTVTGAIAAATAGQTVKILKAGTYPFPATISVANLTIKGNVDGVVFAHDYADNNGIISTIANGITFENVGFNLTNNSSNNANHYFKQTAGTIIMSGCTIIGLIHTMGNMQFDNCTFTTNAGYNIWTQIGNITFNGGEIINNGSSRLVNVYQHNGTNPSNNRYIITFNGTKFTNNGSAGKGALNIHEVADQTTTYVLQYTINMNNVTTEGTFATNKPGYLPYFSVEDIIVGTVTAGVAAGFNGSPTATDVSAGTSNGGDIVVKVDGVTKYSTPKAGQSQRTVTFDGTNTGVVNDGDKIEQPANPAAQSCKAFVEWQLNGVAYDFNSAVTGNIALTSKWNSTCGGGSSTSSSSSNKTGDANTGTNNTGTNNTGTVETGTNNNEETVNPTDPQAVQENGFTKEFNDAYEFAFANGITTMKTIEEAAMDEGLNRIAMAKMLSQYAINVLKKTPDTSKECKFGDVPAELDAEYANGVTLACQLGIMGVGITDFRPFDPVVRAEFGTALSRLLFGIEDGEDAYYTTHLAKLKEAGIISNDDPTLEELRGYVMLMLMRSAK